MIAPLVIHLLKGALDRELHPKLWEGLLTHYAAVSDYVGVIGLTIVFDEAEGFAFLRQEDAASDGEATPRLIVRRPMSYPVSLLCVLLRKKLLEADALGGGARVVLHRDQIVELLRVFLPSTANEVKLINKIDEHIGKVQDLGFLRKLRNQEDTYEVRRIIKAVVDADALANLEETLRLYRDHAEPDA